MGKCNIASEWCGGFVYEFRYILKMIDEEIENNKKWYDCFKYLMHVMLHNFYRVTSPCSDYFGSVDGRDSND